MLRGTDAIWNPKLQASDTNFHGVNQGLYQISHPKWSCLSWMHNMHLRSPKSRSFLLHKIVKQLSDDFYFPTSPTTEPFCHLTWPKTFNLVIDDFGDKYFGKHNSDNLNNTFKKHCNVTIDWNGFSFCGIKLKWDHDKKTVDISMENYAKKALAIIHHSPPIKPQHLPPPYNAPV